MAPGSPIPAIAPTLVTDPDDPRIAEFVGLRDRDLRLQDGVFMAEGDPVVERAVRAGYELQALLVDAARTAPVADAVLAAHPVVFAAGPEVLRRITGLGVHRGCIGLFARRPLPSVAEVIDGATRVLVCERVVNPINLGVIARSAVGLGFDALVLDDASVDPLYRRASRVAMGEVFDLPWARAGRFPEGLDPLVEAGFTLVGLTPDADAEPLDRVRYGPDDRVALVLGSEGPGLSDTTGERCHRRVRIPLSGRVDSLNVGAAAAIACYAVGAR